MDLGDCYVMLLLLDLLFISTMEIGRTELFMKIGWT